MKEELKQRIRDFIHSLRSDPKATDAECEALHDIIKDIATSKAGKATPAKVTK